MKSFKCPNGIRAAHQVFGKRNFIHFLSVRTIFDLFFWGFFFVERNEYIQLAMKYQPLNLGQGFTDYPVPKYITDALAATANSPNCLLNQYTRGFVSKCSIIQFCDAFAMFVFCSL